MNKKQSWNINTLFLVTIFGFTAASLLKPDTEFSDNENRALAQRPKLSAETLLGGQFSTDYENYLTDQFVLRDHWIGLKTEAERAMLKQETNDVYFADDDYLIEKHTGSFDTDLARSNISLLSSFFEKLAGQYDSQHLTAMVVPNAVDILRDKLPAFAAPYDEEVYLDQIRSSLPEGVWLDTSVLLQGHKEEELYYRTDHHWKTLSAFYAYQQWCTKAGLKAAVPEDYTIQTVTEEFQGTISSKVGMKVPSDSIQIYEPKEPVSYTLTYNQSEDVRSSLYDMTQLNGKDKYAVFLGGNYGLIEAKTDASAGRRLLVLKDSYAHCFLPFVIQNFDQVDIVDLRYFNQSLSEYMASKDYTDVLFLYNASGFAEDTSLAKLGV
ncbi:MAG: DHHW family protein [Lachnospiraceae bacterium]|nr:DHHW family protein [Lachnospiraceae bacterium]